MSGTVKLISVIIMLLSFSLPILAGQVSDNKANIGVLEERIRGNAEKTDIQVKALKDEITLRTDSLEKRMNLYLGFALGLLTIIGIITFKTISKWIKQTIVSKTDEEIKNYVTKEYIETLLKEKGEAAINTLLSELEAKGKEKLSELENVKTEYENSLNDLKCGNIDISKPLPEKTVENLRQFEENVDKLKDEEKYLFDDWFYKGIAEHDERKYDEAARSWTRAIKRNPTSKSAYNNRGAAYSKLKQYESAIEDYNKAIELDPKYAIAYNNRGNTYNNLKQYEKAIEDYNKAIELNPKFARAYNNISESKIIVGNYEGALDSIAKVLSLSLETEEKAICHYLECISKKLLGMDTLECERAFNEILKDGFTTTLSFDEIESWLKDADINDDVKRFITEKTEMLKKHKE